MITDFKFNLRRRFADEILASMKSNRDIIVVSGDLGYRVWDGVRAAYPDRFINVGAAEQAMIGVGVGLALEGKIPIVYSITPFLLYRPFESIRNYVHHEKIPLKLIGSGRDKDFLNDGISHWSCEDKKVMKIFSNIKSYWPKNVQDVSHLVPKMLRDKSPWYINLIR